MNHKVSINQKLTIYSAMNSNEAIQTACELIAKDISNKLGEGLTLPEAVQNSFMFMVDEIDTKPEQPRKFQMFQKGWD